VFERVRLRLVIANVAVIAGIVLALGLGVVLAMDRFLVDQRAATLRTVAREVAEQLRADPRDIRALPGTGPAGTFALVWDATGSLVADPSGVADDALRTAAGAATPDGTEAVVDLASGSEVIVISFLATGGGVVQVGADLTPVRDVERQMTLLLVVAGSIGLVLAIVAGWVLAERSMRPISRALERQREFTADASHELRTPLAVVDAGLQVLARHPERPVAEHTETLDAMRDEVGRMNRLVGGLLALARVDAGVAEIAPVATDVDTIVRRVVSGFAPLAAERGATIELGECAVGTASLDPDRITELLGILIDNALVHAGPGVHVRVTARRDGSIELIVADDGIGIPAPERARATERFVRGDVARSGDGAGLGLSIARWIVDAHHGRLSLEDNGPGLRARITLPA
jgi:two-component system sensor histidine kinase CiaH